MMPILLKKKVSASFHVFYCVKVVPNDAFETQLGVYITHRVQTIHKTKQCNIQHTTLIPSTIFFQTLERLRKHFTET